MDLSNRAFLVTGGSRGMGLAIARRFARAGAAVTLLARSAQGLEEAAASLRAEGLPVAATLALDLGAEPDLEAASARIMAEHGPFDGLINNAGIAGDPVPILQMSAAAWDGMMAVNLRAPLLLAVAFARARVAAGLPGVILNNASIAGLAVDGAYSHYSAAKAALIQLTRNLAVELAPHRIRVNAISPGYIRTEMTTGYFTPEAAGYFDGGFQRVPIRRLVTSEEIAEAFCFLASDAASGITAANLVVDGGLTANWFIMESMPQSLFNPGVSPAP